MQNISYPIDIAHTRRWFSSRPVKLFMFVFVGNLLPVFFYFELFYGGFEANPLNLLLTSLAALGAWFMQSRLGSYSRTSRMALILPTTLGLFAIVYFAILTLRIQYSIATLVITLFGTISVGFAYAMINRNKSFARYVVPGGSVDDVMHFGEAELIAHPDVSLINDIHRDSCIIVADLHFDHCSEWERFLADAALHNIPVLHYKQLWESYSGQVRIDRLSENSFGSLIPNRPYMRIKRYADLLISLLLIPILLPMFAVIAVLIKMKSDGPIFFLQERVGYRGAPFRMIKFRTMHQRDSAAMALRDENITRDEDERITPLGRVLRRYRIDELPQIFNIIAGNMSWIGPRPEAISLSQWYGESIPFYAYRHVVRPGITGWAQVNQGHVADIASVNDKLRYDFYYIKYFSYWLDMLVLLKTARVVFGGFGVK